MSAATVYARPAGLSSLSALGMLRSEWIKLRSLRSTIWSYAAVIVVSLGISLLISAAAVGFGGVEGIPIAAATYGIYFGQLVVAVLGVLVISGEYSTGMIRSTLTAIPKRIPALVAKAVVLFLTTFVVGLISVFGAVGVSLLVLSGQPDVAVSGEDLGNLVLAAVYLALTSLFALGLGTILRNGAGGIAVALGVILLLPTIFGLIAGITQAEWASNALPYLFSSAGTGMYTPSGEEGFSQLHNSVIVLVWTAVSLVGGALLLKARDA